MSFSGDLYPTAGATSVMTSKGDIVRFDSQRERYGILATGKVLTVSSGGLPAWEDAGHVTQSRALEVACSDETTPTPEPTPTTPVSTISILPIIIIAVVLIVILLFLRRKA